MIGAGTIINPIIKIVTTVVILGAIYVFFVKPALDTAEDISGDVGASVREAQDEALERSEQIALDNLESRAESYGNSLRSSWPEASRAVRECAKNAKGDASAMEKCVDLGSTIATQVQSNRNFARSYASSLDAQGRTGDSAAVLTCVEQAGFKVGAMQRCRNLADRLLFG